MQALYCQDVNRVFFGAAPVLSVMAGAYGKNVAETWMGLQLNNLSEFTGCRERLSTKQIDELAAMIREEYGHYKLTEFMLFFQRFKRCAYGKFYGAVDPIVIMGALKTFDEERARIIDNRRAAIEREESEKKRQEAEALKERYLSRVPNAGTPEAPLTFLQYRLMGYDTMPDDQLKKEIEDIASGAKEIPQDVKGILDLIRSAF